MYSKPLSPSHHVTLHSFSSDGKVESRYQCGPLMLPLLLMADDSSTLEAEHQWHPCTSFRTHHARSHKHHRKAKPQLCDVLRAACSDLQHLFQLCRASLSTYLCLHHCCFLPTGSGLTVPLFFCVPAVIHGWAAVAELLNI